MCENYYRPAKSEKKNNNILAILFWMLLISTGIFGISYLIEKYTLWLESLFILATTYCAIRYIDNFV